MSGAGWATRRAAATQGVSTRMVEYAGEVQKKGVAELVGMVTSGHLKLHHAVPVARLPREEQLEIVEGGADAVRAAARRLRHEAARARAVAFGELDLEVHLVGDLDEAAEVLSDELGPRVACALASRILAGLAEDRSTMRYLKHTSRNVAGRSEVSR